MSAATLENIIPKPVSATAMGDTFTLTDTAKIYVESGRSELQVIGQYLADKLNPSTGYEIEVLAATTAPLAGNIYLTTSGADATLGEEGYELTIEENQVTLSAPHPAGVFRGVQTIRQLLPPAIESSAVQPGPWEMATGTIRDYPRFTWRGAMLDVARHFFGVEHVKRFIDLLAAYKINVLHLHLTDDQGWRIMIDSWPNLAIHGGSTQVGGGPGGYYTQAQYADLVAYAASRYVTIIPEIDLPGHTNAALASYPELNRDGQAPPLYTGTEVGFSTLWADKEISFQFIDDVIRELAALTPAPYIHVGGDESGATPPDDFVQFIERTQEIVRSHGKETIGWEEISRASLLPSTVVHFWTKEIAQTAIDRGNQMIMSPANKAYLDMKYDDSSPLGLDWAATINVEQGYTWDPATQVEGVTEDNLLGIEAPLWSETIETMADIEWLTFPRLPGYAEIGWSPASGRAWDEYKHRLAAHSPRLSAMDVNFYRSPLVPWQQGFVKV